MSMIARKKTQSKYAIYRHMAIGTIALAGSIAMFADGEARQSATALAQDAQAEAANLPNVKPSPMQIRNAKSRGQQPAGGSQSGWEDQAGYGLPMDSAIGSERVVATSGHAQPSTQGGDDVPFDLASLDRMTPAQRQAAIARQNLQAQQRRQPPKYQMLEIPGQPPAMVTGPGASQDMPDDLGFQ